MPAAADGPRWATWSILCSCRQIAAHQVDLDLVAGCQTADQVGAAAPGVLRDRDHRRDVVAGMRVLGGQERVVEVEFAHRDAVGPRRPFGREGAGRRRTPWRRGVYGCACACARAFDDRPAQHGGRGDGGVVDDPVDDHLGGVRVATSTGSVATSAIFQARCSLGELLGGAAGANEVGLHRSSWQRVSVSDSHATQHG